MKSNMPAKFSSSFLGLASCFLMLCSLTAISAQSRSAAVNLEGTEWATAATSYAVGSAMGTVQCFYIFEGKGKATYGCLAIQSSGTMAGTNLNDPMFIPGTDDPYKPKLVTTPGGSAFPKADGKYTQSGNSIRVEFSDAVMNITIKDNILTGETVYTDKSKAKEKWVMQRISKNKSDSVADNKNTNPKKQPSISEQLALQQQAEMRESENKSQFSLPESLVSRYNPKPLRTNTISFQSSANLPQETNYYSFLAGSGEVSISLTVKAGQQSYTSAVNVIVFDRDMKEIAKISVMPSMGKVEKKVERLNISNKQAFLLMVISSSYGEFGAYDIELNGAVNFK